MYLSKLEVIGFKSFAQKVNLTFDSGISAIVGPNGCGKTNIVDAIRWVLGEQRYSALRSEKMEDVIFNGTKARKPLGMAEVSLVIENTKGILPSEYSEVTVGRRVYRSGESEYLLNRVPCRLKDILDLFMDTGMGADAYSVIELKMVESILSDKTDERRHLFEEAAGVTKYKHRRRAAYRKLESVQADLVRVNDIVSEVQKAVSALERQARKAEQYNGVKTRLRLLEIDFMERELAQLTGRSIPVKERLAAFAGEKARNDAALAAEEAALEALRDRMLDVEHRLGEAQRDVGLHREKMHRVEEKNLVAAERIRALRADIARLEREIVDLRAEEDREGENTQACRQQIEEFSTRGENLQSEHDRRHAELQDVESRLEAKKLDARELNERMIALVHQIADGQTEVDRTKGRVENLTGRVERAEEEIAAYEGEIVRLDAALAELTDEDKQLRRSFAEAEIRFYDAEAQKKELQLRFEDLQRTTLDRQSDIQRIKARVDFLKGLVESREGLSEGVKYLASSGKWNPSRNLTVAEAVHADQQYRVAVEAALGEIAGYLVVDSIADADAGIRLLTEDQKGKATFVCLDRLPHIHAHDVLPDIPGVLGWAADLARFDDAYAQLFRFALDRVLVVQSRETALNVASALSGFRCVTLDGEILTGVGVSRGGSRREDEGGTIGKQQQIRELEGALTSAQEVVESLERSREDIARQRDAIDLKTFSDAVKAIEKEMNGVEMRIAQLVFEKKRAEDVIGRNRDEIAHLGSELADLQSAVEASLPELEVRKNQKSDVERNTGALAQEVQTLEAEWNERASVVQDLGIELVRARGEMQNVREALQRAEQRMEDISAILQKHAAGIHAATSEIGMLQAAIGDNAGMLEEYAAERERLETHRTAIQQEVNHSREEMHRLELALRDYRKTGEEILQGLHENDLKLADLTAKADHIRARALEEFEHTMELKSYPDGEFVDFAALRDEIHSMRERVKALGNINFAAFEEYSTEKQRLEFMTAQRKDLIEAEKTLLATIDEINSTAQKQFLETFGKIRQNFIETFKSLFDPGDECDLKLEENVDPLEARIEIVAKPRGKRPTSIDLLSGGEKTLTATALLFAIYLVKPSPFCILDEVDAPLDDANIDRFTRILRKFSNNTQFIVVTHNKRTMEAANALYGVTMEEEGISKIVTVRFNQVSQLAAAAVAS